MKLEALTVNRLKRRSISEIARISTTFAIALFVAVVTMAVTPETTHAQRGSTSKGKVERSKSSRSKASPQKSRSSRSGATSSRSSASRSSKSGSSGARASGSRSTGSQASDSRSSGSRTRATQSSSRNSSSSRSSSGRSSSSQASSRGASGSGSRSAGSRATQSQSGEARSSSTRSTGAAQASKGRSSSDRSRATNARSGASSRSGAASSSGNRTLSRAASGRTAAARGASSTRNNRVVIEGRRSRLNLPNLRASYRYSGAKSLRFRTHLHVWSPRIYYRRPHTRIHIHIDWPWQLRYRRNWAPRYRYRQVVYVRSEWGGEYRESRIEMETTYRHQLKHATDEYAVLNIEIEQIALYDGDRYLGSVDQIPTHLRRVEATVFRNGDVAFDRDIFVVGDKRAGFELISTEFTGGYALADFDSNQRYWVGRLNLRSGNVSSASRSRLFNPRSFNGFAPISLLPENEGWLWDYGNDAISAQSDDYGDYYGYSSVGDGAYRNVQPRSSTDDYGYSTAFGADVNINRKSEIRRIE